MNREYIDVSRHHPRVKVITLAMLIIDLIFVVLVTSPIAF